MPVSGLSSSDREFVVPRVLIADNVETLAANTLRERGVEVEYLPELRKDPVALASALTGVEGLLVRSAVRVDAGLLEGADALRVIGRAGVGVDNIDIAAATAKGIAVMNVPLGNTVTTAEHTIAMMLALVRHIPLADASMRAGRWERGGFVGTEIAGKVLGVVGCGNVGSEVALRAVGLGMRVLVHDPHLPEDRAGALGAVSVGELGELLARSDIVTLHLPVLEQTRNLISAARIAEMKPGARLINCARGGLIDEHALHSALVEGRLAGAAMDVFEIEPPADSPLPALPNVISTPHLGASTVEAQASVARQVAEQVADFLLEGTVANAINLPSMTAAEASLVRPWLRVAEVLGAFAGQVTESPITEVRIEYVGEAAKHGPRPITAALIAALLRPKLGNEVNMVSAPDIARRRGIAVTESVSDARGAFGSYAKLTVVTVQQTRSIAGTVFSDGAPRIIQIKGVDLEAVPQPHMLYATNVDQPGFIGAVGTTLGEAGVNIATVALGRDHEGGEAVTLIGLDEPPGESLVERIRRLPQVKQVKAVRFP